MWSGMPAAELTRPVFLYQSKLEFFGFNSQYHLI